MISAQRRMLLVGLGTSVLGAAVAIACGGGTEPPAEELTGTDAGTSTSSSSSTSSGGSTSSSSSTSSGGSTSSSSSSSSGGSSGGTPVDECANNTADCVANASCTDLPQGFSCSCPAGYAGSGRPASGGTVDLGDAGCVPDSGGGAADGGDAGGASVADAGDAGPAPTSCAKAAGCADIDECAAQTDDCVKQPHPSRVCTNSAGTFSCGCRANYTGNGRVGDGGTGCDFRGDTLHYRFDGAGTTVPNLATNPPVGTATASLVGAITQGAGGQCAGALIGTGGAATSDYVDTKWATDFGTGSWTISFWAKDVPSTTSVYYFLGDVGAGSLRVFTGGVAGANNFILRGPLTDTLIPGAAQTTSTMTTFVYDSVAAVTRGYLNGTLSVTVNQSALNVNGTGFHVSGYGTGGAGLPSGTELDEVRVFKRALTGAEIADLYTFTNGCFQN